MAQGAAQYVSLISRGEQNEFSLLLLMVFSGCFSISEALGGISSNAFALNWRYESWAFLNARAFVPSDFTAQE